MNAAIAVLLLSGNSVNAQSGSALYNLTIEDAEDQVARALEAQGAAEKVKATMIGKRDAVLYSNGDPMNVLVKTLTFDQASGKWSGNLLIREGEEVLSAIPASGRYEAQVEVPVLRHKMVKDETVEVEDIALLAMPESKVRKGMVMDPQSLVGQSVRRMISPNRPIRQDEVSAPQAIRKGGAVKMTYKTDAIQIQATGEALQDGAVGDTIRVRNDASKAVVLGKVINGSEVEVTQ